MSSPTLPIFSVGQFLAQAGRGPLIVCLGGFGSPVEKVAHDRIGVFGWPLPGALRVDAWLPRSERPALLEALGSRVALGGWDVMYATPWSVAWAAREDRLVAWSTAGMGIAIEGERVEIGGQVVARSSVKSVKGWLAADWVRRGVQLVVDDRCVEGIMVEQEGADLGGPFYDGLDLLADSGWIHELGRLLAARLAVPYVDGV